MTQLPSNVIRPKRSATGMNSAGAMTPAEFHDYVAKLHARWTPVMKAARISAG